MCAHIHKWCILITLINDEGRAPGHDCEPGTTHSFAHHCFIPFDLNLNPSKLDGCICQGGCTLTCWDQKPDSGKFCAIRLCLRPRITWCSPNSSLVAPTLLCFMRSVCLCPDYFKQRGWACAALSPAPDHAAEPWFSAARERTGCWGHRGGPGGCAANWEGSH